MSMYRLEFIFVWGDGWNSERISWLWNFLSLTISTAGLLATACGEADASMIAQTQAFGVLCVYLYTSIY